MTLTVEAVAKALPPALKANATPQFVHTINNIVIDPVVAKEVRDNFISYAHVLRDGKFKTEDYLNAVVYVSFKLMNLSNQDAYFKTFPQRHAALVAKGTSMKDISAYVSAYNSNKLVNLIMEQCAIPTWVLNQDLFQKALNTQADLMNNAASEMVRMQAANSILTHLKRPEAAAPPININLNESSGMVEMKEMLTKLAGQQQDLISKGITPKEIAAQTIIDIETK